MPLWTYSKKTCLFASCIYMDDWMLWCQRNFI